MHNGIGGTPGASLPQVQTLEQLISQVNEVSKQITTAVSNHDGNASSHPSILKLITDAETRITGINTGLANLRAIIGETTTAPIFNTFAKASDLSGHLGSVDSTEPAAHVKKVDRTNWDGKLNAGAYTGTGKQLDDRIIAITTAIGADGTAGTTASGILKAINDVNALISAMKGGIGLIDTGYLNALRAHVSRFTTAAVIDHVDWTRVDARMVAVHTTAGEWPFEDPLVPRRSPVFLVARLSADAIYDDVTKADAVSDVVNDSAIKGKTAFSRMTRNQRIKPGRIYIKWSNSHPWNAYVDFSVAFDEKTNSRGMNFMGRIEASGTRGTRPAVPITLQPKGNTHSVNGDEIILDCALMFGLYEGTDRNGTRQVYIGVLPQLDMFGNNTQGARLPDIGDGGITSGMDFYVSGVNIIPLAHGSATELINNGQVHEIAITNLKEPGNVFVNNVYATDTITGDVILDTGGNDVIRTEHNPKPGSLAIGDPSRPKPLTINSLNRPTIRQGGDTGGAHKMAYLSDIVNSVTWQREVDIVVPDSDTLINSRVRVEDPNVPDDQLVFLPPDSTSGVSVPGIYTSDPERPNVTGKVFREEDVALVMKGGLSNNPLTEGLPNGVLNIGGKPNNVGPYKRSQIVGLDLPGDKWAPKANFPVSVIATGDTSIDTAGERAVYNLIRADGDDVWLSSDAPGIRFMYNNAAYYTFKNGNWVDEERINVPRSADGFMMDITYEWAGLISNLQRMSKSGYHFYVSSYVRWSPRFQNESLYSLPDWNFIDLPLEGIRNADQQDTIDTAILNNSLIGSDYYATEDTIKLEIPERPIATVNNPAYIHNRPWGGQAFIDAGGGSAALQPTGHQWLIDGGDFSGGVAPTLIAPDVPPGNFFGQAIMRQWHGKYDEMMELVAAATAGTSVSSVWEAFERTFRWCLAASADVAQPVPSANNEPELYFSDEGQNEKIYRFLPMEAFKSTMLRIMQHLHWVDNNDGTINLQYESTDFSVKGKTRLVERMSSWTSDTSKLLLNLDKQTLAFKLIQKAAGRRDIEVSSPRMDELEEQLNKLWLTGVNVKTATSGPNFEIEYTAHNPMEDISSAITKSIFAITGDILHFDYTSGVKVTAPRVDALESDMADAQNKINNIEGELVRLETVVIKSVNDDLQQAKIDLAKATSDLEAEVVNQVSRLDGVDGALDQKIDDTRSDLEGIINGVESSLTSKINSDVDVVAQALITLKAEVDVIDQHVTSVDNRLGPLLGPTGAVQKLREDLTALAKWVPTGNPPAGGGNWTWAWDSAAGTMGWRNIP